MPVAIDGVPVEILTARDTREDEDAFDAQARKLAGMFRDHFVTYKDQMDPSVAGSGPVG